MNNLSTKDKHPEITKGYPIFECIPGIPITDQAYNRHQTEDYEIASTHGNKDDDDIAEYWEEEKIIEEESYDKYGQYEYQ